MQQLQRQRGGGGLTDLIGAFLPVGPGSLIGGANRPNSNGYLTNNNANNGQNPATLSQLLGLTPQQPNNGGGALSALGLNPYANNNNNNGLINQRANLRNPYGQPNANLRSSNDNGANSNSNDRSADDNGSEDNGENSEGDNSGDNNEEEGGNENQNQTNQPDPSQDPDIQQFNNLQGNENFPGDLFPAGILSETDLKDIQKSMEEQAKKEAEKQRQQEGGGDGNEGNGEEEGNNNSEDDSGNASGDQSNDDESSSTDDTNANQTDGAQENSNEEADAKNDQPEEANNGKLNTGTNSAAKPNSGYIVNDGGSTTGLTSLSNKNKLSNNRPTSGYSYNNGLRPNSYKNVNSNVQYEDDKSLINNNNGLKQSYRPGSVNGNLPNRNHINGQSGYARGQGVGDAYRPNYGSRFNNNDYRGGSRLGGGGGRFREPYNNYGSQVDYSPEYNQDRLNADRFNQDGGGAYNSPDYNPMSNYRPNELLSRHLNRQHGDINNYNPRDTNLRDRSYVNSLGVDRTRLRNYSNGRDPTGSLGSLGNERSTVNYEPEN